jgi:hypothetical protein
VSTKTSRKRTPKRAPAAKASRPSLTVIDVHEPLPVRRPRFTGPPTPAELAEARAALASAMLQLPIPVLAWHGHTALLQDGTRLTHTDTRAPAYTTPAAPPQFTALTPCPHGAIHQATITSAAQLHTARTTAANCTRKHANDAQHRAIVRPLGEGIHRAKAATDDTQNLSLDDIADTLDQAKEHPEP